MIKSKVAISQYKDLDSGNQSTSDRDRQRVSQNKAGLDESIPILQGKLLIS